MNTGLVQRSRCATGRGSSSRVGGISRSSPLSGKLLQVLRWLRRCGSNGLTGASEGDRPTAQARVKLGLRPGRCIPHQPFLLAQNPGYKHVGQALRFCLSDLVRMKDVPARPQPSALDFGFDLGQQALNTKGARVEGCWSSRAQRLSSHRQPGRQSRPCGSQVALTSGFRGTRA